MSNAPNSLTKGGLHWLVYPDIVREVVPAEVVLEDGVVIGDVQRAVLIRRSEISPSGSTRRVPRKIAQAD